ncbi:MAG TPA: NADH-quinone oxidoreductase subunit J [Acidobacteriota bacterium]|nr:NADH-quinone oxidoreductase subunit J [Acidobacteriota bacterium]
MSLTAQVVFYIFAAITVVSACIVVFSRSLIYSAFGLLFTFFGVATLYVYLGADFLAATQMVIYVGGILVLLLFGVMLTHKLYDLKLKTETIQFVPALFVMLSVFVTLLGVMLKTHWYDGGPKPPAPTTAAIGELFMKDYILPFEIASIFLLISLIGAAMIVRRRAE